MDKSGGGIKEVELFDENREFLPTSEELTPEFRRGQEVENLETRDPRLSNAIGIATVGATGVMPEVGTQATEQVGVLPTDNRTAEEIAINAPEVARDGDRMEKEWMDRAREVVKETKNDPNGRLQRTARLREDYMRKRFNRILGERNDV